MVLSWMLFVKLLHVLSAILFISGMLGRGLAFARARLAGDVQVAHAMLGLSERFEQLLVRPGSEAVFVLGLATAWLQGQPLLGFLAGSRPNWPFVSLVLYLLTVPLVMVILLPRSRRRRQAAEAALAEGRITPELHAALNDRTVMLTRDVELLIILLVVALMVLKPF